MIYLIGGPVRVGKSRLARMIVDRKHIAAVSTDALTTMIGRVLPETRLAGKHVPQLEWEENFYPFLRRFIKTTTTDFTDYAIEGAALSPKIANRLSQKYPIRAIFLGNTSPTVAGLIDNMGNNVWLRNARAGELVNIPVHIQRRSLEIASDCELYGYPFIDLVGDFKGGMERAFEILVEEKYPLN